MDHQRHLQLVLAVVAIGTPAVATCFVEFCTVVGRDDDNGIVHQVLTNQLVEDMDQLLINKVSGISVTVLQQSGRSRSLAGYILSSTAQRRFKLRRAKSPSSSKFSHRCQFNIAEPRLSRMDLVCQASPSTPRWLSLSLLVTVISTCYFSPAGTVVEKIASRVDWMSRTQIICTEQAKLVTAPFRVYSSKHR